MKFRARKQLLFVRLSLLTVATCCYGADSAAHPEMLVSTAWLADHLNDPKVVVLQVGHERSDYAKEHIPGARFLSTSDYTTGHSGLMVELPTVERLKQSFEDLGVSDDTRVVIYTADWYPIAAALHSGRQRIVRLRQRSQKSLREA